jgi:aromatase
MILELIDTATIEGEREEAFRCFWRAELWPQLTSHVTRVEMLEERDCWQKYALYVQVDGKDYAMITQRIAVPARFISFQQPKPPHFMNGHSGVWSFEDDGSGNTKVSVAHRVDFDAAKAMEALGANSGEEARLKLQHNLHHNGMAMIASVDAFLKAQREKSLFSASAAD